MEIDVIEYSIVAGNDIQHMIMVVDVENNFIIGTKENNSGSFAIIDAITDCLSAYDSDYRFSMDMETESHDCECCGYYEDMTVTYLCKKGAMQFYEYGHFGGGNYDVDGIKKEFANIGIILNFYCKNESFVLNYK